MFFYPGALFRGYLSMEICDNGHTPVAHESYLLNIVGNGVKINKKINGFNYPYVTSCG